MTGWDFFATPEGAAALIIGCDGRLLGLRYREFVESVVRTAIEAERAAVVDFVRSLSIALIDGPFLRTDRLDRELDGLADAIERGEHRP